MGPQGQGTLSLLFPVLGSESLCPCDGVGLCVLVGGAAVGLCILLSLGNCRALWDLGRWCVGT